MTWHTSIDPLDTDGGSPGRPVPVVLTIALGVLAVLAVGALIYPVLSLPHYVIHDWNEGWNAYWSDVAIEGGALYPPGDALVSNNYPPLSFYVVGLAGKLTGDTIAAGRAIALLSLLVVAVNIGVWLKLAGASRGSTWFASLLFLCTAAIAAPHYLAMNDPQWLGHALMTTGMVAMWRSPGQAVALAAGSLLMLAGGWVKHLLIPLPVVAGIWLLCRSKRTGIAWIVGSVLMATALFVGAWLLYGNAFFENLFNTPRDFSLRRLWRQADHLLLLLPVLCAAVLAGRRLIGDVPSRFALAYLCVSLLLGFLTSGGAGIDMNRYFDAVIAGSMIAGLLLDHATGSTVRLGTWHVDKASIYATLLTAITAAQLLLPLTADVQKTASLIEREQTMLTDVATLRTYGVSKAVCDTPAICYWAGAPFLVDMFNFGQKQRATGTAGTTCSSLMDSGVYSVIVLDRNHSTGSHRMTPACLEAIHRRYQVAMTTASSEFLVIKDLPPP